MQGLGIIYSAIEEGSLVTRAENKIYIISKIKPLLNVLSLNHMTQ